MAALIVGGDHVAVYTQIDLLPFTMWGDQAVTTDPFTGDDVPVAYSQRVTPPTDSDGGVAFAGWPTRLVATRSHWLIGDEATVPEHLEISARSDDGLVMGLRHRHQLTEAVQFHPESILTVAGHQLLGNFLTLAGRPAPQPPVVSSPS